MNEHLNLFALSNYPDFPTKPNFIYTYSPPGMVRIRGNVKGDTFIVNSTEDCWEILYGGDYYTIDWNHKDLHGVNSSLINLWKHHLTEEMQTKAPPTVHAKFRAFLNVARKIDSSISLASLLSAFSEMYATKSPTEIYYLRVFYNWGVVNGIDVFDRNIQIIIDNLPAPQRNPYESIFLQQSYITPEQDALLIGYIEKCISNVEEIPLEHFDKSSFRDLRSAVLLMLVYETAPRPLQIFMLTRDDISHVDDGRDGYFSIRFRRNKNRHLSKEYTSPRDISIRLGRALKKLVQLNQMLFGQRDDAASPMFLNSKGQRWSTTAISMDVGSSLKSVFGADKLDVEGSLTPFRHHLGQALADQGAPPAVIADRLGHSTEVAARAYITATPNIAKIKTRALGENDTYLYLMSALMTGSIMQRKDVEDEAHIVRGTVGSHYIEGIGACDVKGHCRTNPVFACYTCRKFHPFIDGPHEQVIKALQEQVVTFLNSTADVQHSRPLTQLEIVIESAKAVALECKKHVE